MGGRECLGDKVFCKHRAPRNPKALDRPADVRIFSAPVGIEVCALSHFPWRETPGHALMAHT